MVIDMEIEIEIKSRVPTSLVEVMVGRLKHFEPLSPPFRESRSCLYLSVVTDSHLIK